jgi:hypothetical protein
MLRGLGRRHLVAAVFGVLSRRLLHELVLFASRGLVSRVVLRLYLLLGLMLAMGILGAMRETGRTRASDCAHENDRAVHS